MESNKLEDTEAIIRLYIFLRYECGLRDAESLSDEQLRHLLNCICNRK